MLISMDKNFDIIQNYRLFLKNIWTVYNIFNKNIQFVYIFLFIYQTVKFIYDVIYNRI